MFIPMRTSANTQRYTMNHLYTSGSTQVKPSVRLKITCGAIAKIAGLPKIRAWEGRWADSALLGLIFCFFFI
jgi:hypothetical protein